MTRAIDHPAWAYAKGILPSPSTVPTHNRRSVRRLPILFPQVGREGRALDTVDFMPPSAWPDSQWAHELDELSKIDTLADKMATTGNMFPIPGTGLFSTGTGWIGNYGVERSKIYAYSRGWSPAEAALPPPPSSPAVAPYPYEGRMRDLAALVEYDLPGEHGLMLLCLLHEADPGSGYLDRMRKSTAISRLLMLSRSAFDLAIAAKWEYGLARPEEVSARLGVPLVLSYPGGAPFCPSYPCAHAAALGASAYRLVDTAFIKENPGFHNDLIAWIQALASGRWIAGVQWQASIIAGLDGGWRIAARADGHRPEGAPSPWHHLLPS